MVDWRCSRRRSHCLHDADHRRTWNRAIIPKNICLVFSWSSWRERQDVESIASAVHVAVHLAAIRATHFACQATRASLSCVEFDVLGFVDAADQASVRVQDSVPSSRGANFARIADAGVEGASFDLSSVPLDDHLVLANFNWNIRHQVSSLCVGLNVALGDAVRSCRVDGHVLHNMPL